MAHEHATETFDGAVTGRYWHTLVDGQGNQVVQCDVCPRACKLHDGQRGLCFVRAASHGEIVLTTYGRSSGFCVDPIEKKPLNHFLPGSPVFSFGTAGCNLTCKFCQNLGHAYMQYVSFKDELHVARCKSTCRHCSDRTYMYNLLKNNDKKSKTHNEHTMRPANM